MPEQSFKGRWRITNMDKWDKDFIDLVEPGFIEFLDNNFGAFHFGCIDANLDYQVDEKGKVEFSFCGDDEGQEVFGRGWAQRNNQGLYGSFFFHEGTQLEFEALRDPATCNQTLPYKGFARTRPSML